MRSEEEIYQMVLGIAKEDDRIQALYQNGSRVNVNAPKDIFQDYDLVFVVKATKPWIEDQNWLRKLGEIMYFQLPDETPGEKGNHEETYGWLIQFCDGTRIDLHVESVDYARQKIWEDSLTTILLNKNQTLPKIPPASDRDYQVKPPTKEAYLASCNEFWWCSNNLAKGLWRKELTVVQEMVNQVLRKELEQMLAWKVGILTDYSVSIGKSGKYLPRWLSQEEWDQYLATYFRADVDEAWEAVTQMVALFEQTAHFVGEKAGFTYNQNEADAACEFLFHVQKLPEDALGIY